MIIRHLHLDSFGVYSDQSMGPLPPGLVVFRGDNEAGKSTFVGFVRAVLFGFPRANERARSYPLPAVGRPAGHLVLETREGACYQVTRQVSRKAAGEVLIAPLEGAPARLLEDLLGGVTRDVFRNVFAFSLDDLRDFRSMETEQVRAVLYGASAGTCIQALPDARRHLDDRARKLLSVDPKPIGVHLSLLAAKREELRKALGRVGEYDRAWEELQAVIEEIHGRESRHVDAISEGAALEVTLQMWEPWEQRLHCLDALRSMPAGLDGFPPDGLARLDQACVLSRERQAQVAGFEAELLSQQAELEKARVDPALVREAEAVIALRDGRAQFLEAQQALESLHSQAEKVDASLRAALAHLGPDWDPERVRASCALQGTEEAILDFQGRLSRAGATVEGAAQALREKEELLAQRTAAEEEARANLDALVLSESLADSGLISTLQAGRDRFRAESEELEDIRRTAHSETSRLDAELRELVAAWGWTQLGALDGPRARTSLEALVHQVDEKERTRMQASLAVEEAERALREAEGARERRQSELVASATSGNLTREDIRARQQALSTLRGLVRERDQSEGVVRDLAPPCDARRRDIEAMDRQEATRVGAALALTGLVLMVAGLATGGALLAVGQTGMAAGLGGVLASVGLMLLAVFMVQRKSGAEQTRAQRERLEKELADLEARRKQAGTVLESAEAMLTETARQAGMTPPCTAAGVERHDVELRTLSMMTEAHAIKQEELARCHEHVTTRQRDLADRRARLEEREEEGRLLASSAAQSLASLGLPREWRPAEALGVVARLEVLQQRLRQVETSMARVRTLEDSTAAWRALAGKAGAHASDATALLGEVDSVLTRERQATDVMAARRTAQEVHQERAMQSRSAGGAVDEAGRRLQEASVVRSDAEAAWRRWLQAHDLSPHLPPQAALALAQGIQAALSALERAESLQADQRKHQALASSYVERAQDLARTLHRAPVVADGAASEVEEVARLLDLQKQTQTRFEHSGSLVERLQLRLVQARAELTVTEAALKDLLESAGCPDEEAFRARAVQAGAWRDLVGQVARLDELLRRLSGQRDVLGLAVRFTGRTQQALQAELDQVRAEQARLRQELDGHDEAGERIPGLRDRKAELELRLQHLGSSEDVGCIRAEEECIKARLRELGLEWSRYKVARHLVDEAWRRFERKAQPGVIRDAGRFFDTITAGAYPEIFSPLSEEKKEFEVQARNGVRKTVDQLSSGTQEQLYLCLRFGFIQHQVQVADPLPVVMDDILVNFDPSRARRAAEAITQLAQSVQVLFFTCHPATVEHFRAVRPDVRVVALDAGCFAEAEASAPV